MFRTFLAIWIGRLVSFLSRWLKRGGTSLPGYIALKIDPNLMKHLTSNYKKVIIVTGTNGKTTTANLLANILKASGLKVIHNTEGANMPAGVTTTLLESPGEVAVLEVDEGTLIHVTKQVKADMVVITNLLRDQLDRYHELEQLVQVINRSLSFIPEATLVLNADDSLVTSLGLNKNNVKYFGLARNELSQEKTTEVLEGHICPICHKPLEFNFYHYSHLGNYFCPSCSYSRPKADYEVNEVKLSFQQVCFNLNYPEGEIYLKTQMPGVYNIYNVLAASSTALQLNVKPVTIMKVVDKFLPGQGRAETFHLQNKKITLMLVKNPTGLSIGLKTIITNSKEAVYLFAINDLAADGRDVSWLWDADITLLVDAPYNLIICSGLRAGDMAIRLKYEGIKMDSVVVVPEQEASVNRLLSESVSEAVIFCTYTNLALYRRILRKRGAESEVAYMSSLS